MILTNPRTQLRAYRLGESLARVIPCRGYHNSGVLSEERKKLPISGKSLNKKTDYNICFLRHGQSTWNRENIFIGWTGKCLCDLTGAEDHS